MDPYDRIWDADQSYTPFHVSSGFNILLSHNLSSGLSESPPVAVLQTARVLARRNALTYNLPLDTLGDYYIVLYFAGILPVSPSFDILINGVVVQSNYTVKKSEASALYLTQKEIKSLNVTLKSIRFYPQINAIEVYEIVEIPLETSSTTGHIRFGYASLMSSFHCSELTPFPSWLSNSPAVSALQVIQQSTGLDLRWEDDPCSPAPWDHIGCEGSLVTSLCVHIKALTYLVHLSLIDLLTYAYLFLFLFLII